MPAFGAILKKLREERGLNQDQLGALFSVKKAAISKYENEHTSPDPDTLIRLADYFGVTTDYLLGRSGSVQVHVPILGTIRAGIPILTEENYGGYLDVPQSIRADFALRVVGDSMIGAGILEGDYAICRENQEPQTGQIIVALHDEGSISEATLKYYFNDSGDPKLKAANPTYTDIAYKNGYRCAGHMIALVREDAPGYQIYRDYIAVAGHEEWTGVIEKAAGAGIKPGHIDSYIDMMIGIGKRQ